MGYGRNKKERRSTPTAARQDSTRSEASAGPKPKLSVSIPSGSSGGGPVLEQKGETEYTAEPEGLDDAQVRFSSIHATTELTYETAANRLPHFDRLALRRGPPALHLGLPHRRL